MPRSLSDLGFPEPMNQWPKPGKYTCVCRDASRWSSPYKGTQGIMLVWESIDGQYRFDDVAWLTPKESNVKRAGLIAAKVCGIPTDKKDFPDDDAEALEVLAEIITKHAQGKAATVTVIVEHTSHFNVETGRTESKKRHRVAWDGYDIAGPLDALGKRVDDMGSDLPPLSDDEQPATDNDLPF